MSRVGIGNNVTQPDARCMSCKRWRNANKWFGEETDIVLFRIAKRREE